MGRRLVRQLHAWVGLALSLLLLLLALSGAALVYKEAYWRLVYPELRGPAPVLSSADHAAALAAARTHFGARIHSFKLPEPGVPAYHLYLDDGEAFLAVDGHQVIDRWRPRERVMALLFDLHAHLLAGERGEQVGGVVALLGALLSATGLVLWWPARRRFAAANLLPRDLSRRALLLWHRDLGAVASPILLLVLLTGSGLVFYNTANALLNGILGRGPAPAAPARPAGTADLSGALADGAMFARVGETLPAARLVFYYPPRDGATLHRFRLQQPCELHPNGRSYVELDGAGRVVRAVDACAAAAGDRATHAMYPLHAGKTPSAVYKLAVLFSGLALAGLSASGVVTYLGKLRRRASA